MTDEDGKAAPIYPAAAQPTADDLDDSIILRQPEISDGAAIWSLIRSTGVLDVNSAYSYLMLSKFFSRTCVVAEAEADQQIVGFVSTFCLPDDPETLFVWQIAVSAAQRGRGLAKAMLKEVLNREAAKGVRFIQATISPSNQPSQALFKSLARDLGTECTVLEAEGFPDHVFPTGSGHEAEWMFRVGPLSYKPLL